MVLETESRRHAFEFKASSAPRPTRGFHSAIASIQADHSFLISIIEGSYPIDPAMTACGLRDCQGLLAAGRGV